MEEVKGYVMRLVAAGFLCGILKMFFRHDKGIAILIQFVMGIAMTFIAISPLTNLEFREINMYLDAADWNNDGIVEEGVVQAREAMSLHISEMTKAYIEEEAMAMGVNLNIEVEVSNEEIPQPVGVILEGKVSPYIKQYISNKITSDLGICEDKQIWK